MFSMYNPRPRIIQRNHKQPIIYIRNNKSKQIHAFRLSSNKRPINISQTTRPIPQKPNGRCRNII